MPTLVRPSYTLTKPMPGSQVDWGHPLAQGLVSLWTLSDGGGLSIQDSVSRGVSPTSGVPAWESIGNQRGLRFGDNKFVTVATPTVGPSFTVAVRAYLTTNTSVNFIRAFLVKSFWAADVDGDFALMIDSVAAGHIDNLEFNVRLGSTTYRCEDTVAAPTLRDFTVMGTYREGDALRLYKDGELRATLANASTYTESVNPCVLGAFPGQTNNTNIDGVISYAAIWRRQLSPYDAKLWHDEPFALLRGPDRWRGYDAIVGGAAASEAVGAQYVRIGDFSRFGPGVG